MPLVLGGVETSRPQTIVWDTQNPQEHIEALARVNELFKQGFTYKDVNPLEGTISMTPPPRDPNKGLFRILTENGDDRVVWDRRSGPQVKDAYKQFNELAAKGYTAYAVTATGDRGHKITEFDPALEEIIMVPSTMPG
jgi:hypothetical protein